MTVYAITALINTIASIFLGFFVYLQDRKTTHKTFALFCLTVAVWSYSYFMWQVSTTESNALFWSRALMAGAVFITVTYLHFVLSLLNKIKENKKILIFGYLIFFLFFLANFTPWFIEGVRPKLNFNFWPDAGILYLPFLIFWFFYAFYSVYLLLKEHSLATGTRQNQMRYILIGTIIGYLGGATNYPLWYDIPILPWGNWSATFYIGVVAYAILQYRLMEIRVILTEFIVGLIAFFLLTEAVVSKTFYELLFRGGLFVVFCIFGYLLIRSVLREIQRRAELQRLYEEVDKLSKAKSEFISIASHQLRTPLTAIKGYISMIIEGTYGKLSSGMAKPLENVYQSNEKLINLVNDLLDLSRLEAGKIAFEPTLASLDKLVSGIIEELKINADKKGLYLKLIRPKEPLPEIMIDQPKLRQVVLNIIDNAIKYTTEGGITVKIQNPKSKIQIVISDTGAGIGKEEIKNLFQMFSRAAAGTKLHAGGAGVGLHVAKKFIEMHQGRIWVESEGKGKGSTFYIELPIVDEAKASSSPSF